MADSGADDFDASFEVMNRKQRAFAGRPRHLRPVVAAGRQAVHNLTIVEVDKLWCQEENSTLLPVQFLNHLKLVFEHLILIVLVPVEYVFLLIQVHLGDRWNMEHPKSKAAINDAAPFD